MQRIGVLGASFNPPTLGHKDVIDQALGSFDMILLVPSLQHAFQKKQIDIAQRLAMLQLFLQFWPPTHKVMIDNIEAKIAKQPIYTFDVMSALEQKYPGASLQFIVGPDLVQPEVWQKFYRYQDIEQKWGLFVAEQRIAIHSTDVREAVRDNPSDLINMVGDKIAEYILQNKLYR